MLKVNRVRYKVWCDGQQTEYDNCNAAIGRAQEKLNDGFTFVTILRVKA